MAFCGREHYARNREAYISRNVANMPLRRRSLKERVWDHVAEQACVDCGERDPLVLDFDHVDPATKLDDIYWRSRAGTDGSPSSMRFQVPGALRELPP